MTLSHQIPQAPSQTSLIEKAETGRGDRGNASLRTRVISTLDHSYSGEEVLTSEVAHVLSDASRAQYDAVRNSHIQVRRAQPCTFNAHAALPQSGSKRQMTE